MSMVPIVDELRTNVPLPTGAHRDDTAAPPITHRPKTLYVFAVREVRKPEGTGQMDDGRFTVRLEYAADPAGEEAKATRSRATSVALDNAADAVANYIRDHRITALHDHMQVDGILYDTVRTLGFRGFAMDLSGYRELNA